MMQPTTVKAPFPYFGGKSKIAPLFWRRVGIVKNFCEPFCGSCATLLARPLTFDCSKTVNDLNAWLTNAWRGIQLFPKATARFCDWPVSELDLHSRGDGCFYRQSEIRGLCETMGYATRCRFGGACPCVNGTPAGFIEWMRADCGRVCPALAGIWVWGCCAWIGDNWSYLSHNAKRDADGEPVAVTKALPHLGNRGVGVNRKLPHLGDRGQAIRAYFRALAQRLRDVRICCGDWQRILTEAPTTTLGLTAVFLDPPYGFVGRDACYGDDDSLTVAADVRQWCLEHGDDPLLRICLCGYASEGHEELEQHGWDVVAWKTRGGYASSSSRGNENRHLERLWFSPHCLKAANRFPLFTET